MELAPFNKAASWKIRLLRRKHRSLGQSYLPARKHKPTDAKHSNSLGDTQSVNLHWVNQCAGPTREVATQALLQTYQSLWWGKLLSLYEAFCLIANCSGEPRRYANASPVSPMTHTVR